MTGVLGWRRGRRRAQRPRAAHANPLPSTAPTPVSCAKPGFDPPICPTADGICQAPAPSVPLANYLAQVQARVASYPNFFYFTAQVRVVGSGWSGKAGKGSKREPKK